MSSDYGIEIDESVLSGFIDESLESLDTLDALFVELEQNTENLDIVNSVFRPIHSIKGNAPFFGLMKLKNLSHDLESILAAVREQKIKLTRQTVNLMLAAVDEIRAILRRRAKNEPEIVEPNYYEDLINSLNQVLTNQPIQTPTPIRETKSSVAENIDSTANCSTKTMRVAEERIDTFLNFVGELVIAQDMLRHFTDKVQSRVNDLEISKDLSVINGVITALGNDLEKAIMSIRKVPIKSLAQKIPRLIRDIAQQRKKEINVIIEGDYIEIDKSLIELLDAPLIHMTRNAADHGIETPEVRTKHGKPAVGTVKIICQENSSDIVIKIVDDGGGLNLNALQKRAEALNLVSSGNQLSENQIISLIFMAGVSTANEVSDISGRGVGMDVVKRNIESAGGNISVQSTPGQGSEFTIKLPKSVTTQIIHGLLIKNADIDIVLPLDRVREIWDYDPSQVIKPATYETCIKHNENILPLLCLHDYLGTSGEKNSSSSRLILTVNSNQSLLAVSIDQVIGMRQLVIKPLDPSLNGDQIFIGGALLGDGNVALVLDVDKLN